jgi:hypothetical protein
VAEKSTKSINFLPTFYNQKWLLGEGTAIAGGYSRIMSRRPGRVTQCAIPARVQSSSPRRHRIQLSTFLHLAAATCRRGRVRAVVQHRHQPRHDRQILRTGQCRAVQERPSARLDRIAKSSLQGTMEHLGIHGSVKLARLCRTSMTPCRASLAAKLKRSTHIACDPKIGMDLPRRNAAHGYITTM